MRRTYYEIQTGDVNITATIKFKGSINANLQHELTTEELIHDMITCGDYEIEVIEAEERIENIENDYEEME